MWLKRSVIHIGKFSIHVQHYRAQQISGIDRHNRRLSINHSNSNIDVSKSGDNITLKPVTDSLYKDVKKRIDREVLASGNRVTKNSIWVTEICCTLPAGIKLSETERYFNEIVKYFESTLGKDNIISAYIHMDETTPHLHLDVTNITPEKRLSRKEIWTRQRLIEIQDQLPTYLQAKGFCVERGDRLEDFEAKKKAHQPLKKYKIYREREKIKKEYNMLVDEYNGLAEKYNAVAKEHREIERGNLKTAKKIIARSQQISR